MTEGSEALFRAKIAIWEEGDSAGGQKVFDSVSYELCRLVDEGLTLAEASRRTGIAYSAAWRRIKEAESAFSMKIMKGRKGRGSSLTPFGKQLVEAYEDALRNTCDSLRAYLN